MIVKTNKIDIIDINGDGLPDKVRNVSDNLKFYFNIGKSFVSNENAIIDELTQF